MKKNGHNLAIVGPKGGVGKTTISANLAIALSNLGKRVIAVDLDLGASNLHTMFGLKESPRTLDDFIFNKVGNLADIVQDTNIGNLGIICGGDVPGIANLHYQKKVKLIRHLSSLEADFVLLDLGAGASYNVVDFVIIARHGLLVTTPEVPSLLNAYGFIKTLIFRRLAFYFKREDAAGLLALLEEAKDAKSNPHLNSMDAFLKAARGINADLAAGAEKIMRRFHPLVVVNRVQRKKDAEAGDIIRKLMGQYLSIKSSSTVTIREDHTVKNAISRMKPVILESPESKFSKDINAIALRLGSLPAPG